MNQKGGAKADIAIKLVLMLFIAILSFSIGTFVGKQVSDSDYKRAELESEYSTPDRATASVSQEAAKPVEIEPNNSLTEDDLSQLTEEFVKAEKKPESMDSKQKVDNAEDIPQESVSAKADIPKEALRIAKGQAPVPDKVVDNRKPSSILPSFPDASIGKFTIQLAAYTTEKEAQEYAESLKAKGFSAFYIPAKIKDHTWYRVSVGLFDSEKSAMSFQKDLRAKLSLKSTFIQKIVK